MSIDKNIQSYLENQERVCPIRIAFAPYLPDVVSPKSKNTTVRCPKYHCCTQKKRELKFVENCRTALKTDKYLPGPRSQTKTIFVAHSV